jgi:hypothetical protein
MQLKPLNAELNPICHFLALLGAHHILHVSRIRVNIPVNFPSSFDMTVCVAKTFKKDGYVNGGTVCWSMSPL